jgi:hypothetical protein
MEPISWHPQELIGGTHDEEKPPFLQDSDIDIWYINGILWDFNGILWDI